MLAKETSDRLAVLGFDVSKLTEAVKAETEVVLEVPKLYAENDYNTFGNNRFTEGKKAMSEILAKDLNDKYGLGLEEKDRKDTDKVIQAMQAKVLADAKIEPDKKVKELQSDLETLRGTLNTAKLEYETKLKTMESQVFTTTMRSTLGAKLAGEYLIPKEDIYDLYQNRHRVTKDENGRAVVLDDKGEVLKTDTSDPVDVAEHFAAFAANYIKKDGMGGGNTGGGTPSKFTKLSEYEAYCKAKNIEPLSEEGQKVLAANKAEKFDYSS